jgi:tetratricopeptide (TPR) repeat protein
MASKEIALTLPGLIFVYEWFFFQDLDKTWLRRSAIYLAVGLLALVALVYWVYDYNPLELLTAIHPTRPYTPFERFLTQGRVVFLYMSLLFFSHPSRLTLEHDISVSEDLIHPWTTWFSLAGLTLLLVITILMAKRYRLFAFCAVWFFANLALEALAASIEPMFEHRVYLPSMLFFVPVVWVAFRILKKPTTVIPPITAFILIFSLWTYERNALWNDPIAFWEDAVQKSPNHYRPHFNLGTAYLHAQSYDRAILSLKKALTLHAPYPTEILTNMGALYLETGQYGLARDSLTRAISLNAKNHMAHVLLGNLSQKEGDDPSAVRQYQAAVRINGNFAESHYNLGIVYMDMGDTGKSVEAFGRAARLRPMWSQAHSNLGLALARQGRYDAALLSLQEAVNIEAKNQEALFNLAKVYSLGGEHERAAETYERLVEINPEDVEAMHNLGVIYLNHLRDVEQAGLYFKKALATNPKYAHAAMAQSILAQTTLKP